MSSIFSIDSLIVNIMIAWAGIIMILSIWGLSLMSNRCHASDLFSQFRTMLVTSAITLTILVATQTCNNVCFNEDEEYHVIVPLSFFIMCLIFWGCGGSILTSMKASSDASNSDGCVDFSYADKLDTYKLVLTYLGMICNIFPFLYSAWVLYQRMKNWRLARRLTERKRQAESTLKQVQKRESRLLNTQKSFTDEDKTLQQIQVIEKKASDLSAKVKEGLRIREKLAPPLPVKKVASLPPRPKLAINPYDSDEAERLFSGRRYDSVSSDDEETF